MNLGDMSLDELCTLVGRWSMAMGYAADQCGFMCHAVGRHWSARVFCGPLASGVSHSSPFADTMLEAMQLAARKMLADLSDREPAQVIELSLARIERAAGRV